jgi:hypothetical protein
VEFLEDDPVADDVLDAVGHHRQRRGEEVGAIAGVAQRGESRDAARSVGGWCHGTLQRAGRTG